MVAAWNQTTFLTKAQVRLGKAIGDHTTQPNEELKGIINKNRQVAPKRIPLCARLAVNTHNMRCRFVKSVKNAQWLMSPTKRGMDSKASLSFRFRSKETTSESMRTNVKDGKMELIKSLRQNWRRMTTGSNWSCYYQPGGGLTRCQRQEFETEGW